MCRHPLAAVTAHHECYAGRQAGLLLFAGAGRLREHSEVKSDLVARGDILDGYLPPATHCRLCGVVLFSDGERFNIAPKSMRFWQRKETVGKDV